MDPQAAARNLFDAINDLKASLTSGSRDEAVWALENCAEHAESLAEWLRRGGFMPAADAPQTLV